MQPAVPVYLHPLSAAVMQPAVPVYLHPLTAAVVQPAVPVCLHPLPLAVVDESVPVRFSVRFAVHFPVVQSSLVMMYVVPAVTDLLPLAVPDEPVWLLTAVMDGPVLVRLSDRAAVYWSVVQPLPVMMHAASNGTDYSSPAVPGGTVRLTAAVPGGTGYSSPAVPNGSDSPTVIVGMPYVWVQRMRLPPSFCPPVWL